MAKTDHTHDAGLRSWVTCANGDNSAGNCAAATDFPIQNLPHGVFRRRGSNEKWRGGVAIGDQILDLSAAHAAGVFASFGVIAERAAVLAGADSLNALMAAGPAAWTGLRHALSALLREGASQAGVLAGALVPQVDAEYRVPARIGDFTDFYTSVYHATNIGRLFRPDAPLMPNFKWLPVGYHGRASSIDVSGQQFHRPRGQTLPPGATSPVFTECKRLDYELEIGIWIGQGNALGEPIPVAETDQHVFGLCLLNDWSARDIQAWEYQPLGPFLAKNFATTISPWIVTLDALAPYRQAWTRAEGDPQPLPYLECSANRAGGAFDVRIETWLESTTMKQAGSGPARLSSSSFKHSYWTVAQMVAHHAVGGCNLQPGDLLGTGTLSGPEATEAAALIELSVGGKNPVTMSNGETRTFLLDGDTVILKGWCEKPGFARIGFGESRGTVLPARGKDRRGVSGWGRSGPSFVRPPRSRGNGMPVGPWKPRPERPDHARRPAPPTGRIAPSVDQRNR